MKKLFVVTLALVLLLGLTAIASANPFGGDYWAPYNQRVNVFDAIGQMQGLIHKDYRTIHNAKVTGGMGEIIYDQGVQDVSVTINTRANIPCYLELELIGNAGYSKVKSIGPGADAHLDRTGESHWMLFDSKFGGIVDADWEEVNVSVFSSVPGQNLFIQACDYWTANLRANIPFMFSVSATEMVHVDDDEVKLSILMQITPDDPFAWEGDYELGSFTTAELTPLVDYTYYMRFRVPFTGILAGGYEGDITFAAASVTIPN